MTASLRCKPNQAPRAGPVGAIKGRPHARRLLVGHPFLHNQTAQAIQFSTSSPSKVISDCPGNEQDMAGTISSACAPLKRRQAQVNDNGVTRLRLPRSWFWRFEDTAQPVQWTLYQTTCYPERSALRHLAKPLCL